MTDNEDISSIDSKKTEINKHISRLKGQRKYAPVILILISITIAIFYVLMRFYLVKPDTSFYNNYGWYIFSTLVGFIFVSIFIYMYLSFSIHNEQIEVEYLNSNRKILTRFPTALEDTKTPNKQYFDQLVAINLENLSTYYNQVKAHTNKSFYVSIFVGIFGFVFIISGIAIGFADKNNPSSISYLISTAGIITEFISAVFFWLYNKTVMQMKDYHDSLVAVQNILLSFKLIDDIKEDQGKLQAIEVMLKYLLGNQKQE